MSYVGFDPAEYSGFGRKRKTIPPRTKEWNILLEHLHDYPSIVILNLGGRGSGKTAEEFKDNEQLFNALHSYGKCAIVFWNMNQQYIDLIKELAKNFGDPIADHVYTVDKLRDLTELKKRYKYMVLCYDEAQRDLNSGDALKKASRRRIKMIAICRQQDIFLIINSQIENIDKKTRLFIDITMYKGITKTAIRESVDDFAKDFKDKIVRLYSPLKKKFCFFNSSYSHFLDKQDRIIENGYLERDLFKVVPWWDERLSRPYGDVNLDSEFEDFLQNLELFEELAKEFIKQFPHCTESDVTNSIVAGWLLGYNKGLYYDLEGMIKVMVQIIKTTFFKEKQKEKSQQSASSDISIKSIQNKKIDIEFTAGIDFPEFVYDNLLKITDKNTSEICKYWTQGLSLRMIYPIAQTMGIGEFTVNSICQEFSTEGLDKNWKIRAGYFFEKWWAGITGGTAAKEESNDPDVIGPDGKRYSCKCYNESKNSLSLQQKKFKPSRDWAIKNNSTYYCVGYFPKWRDEKKNIPPVRILEVDPNGNDYVKFDKKDPSQYFFFKNTAEKEISEHKEGEKK